MKMLVFVLFALLNVSPTSVIPMPVSVTEKTGVYECPDRPSCRIYGETDGMDGLERYLESQSLPMVSKGNVNVSIRFVRSMKGLPADVDAVRNTAYVLDIQPKGICIEAACVQGAFYALQTLRQMLLQGNTLLCSRTVDWCRFGWRGLMVDGGPYYDNMENMLKQIDAMALMKLNVLHFHLTDSGYWRVETESYPRLNQMYRLGRERESWSRNRQFVDKDFPGSYGKWFTKDQIREIIRYASDRGIDIVPEVDMPGHVFQVLHAYPELRCDSFDEILATHENVYHFELCMGNPKTLEFAYKVYDEIADLFPSKYIHIGGDETYMHCWRKCSVCHAFMEKEGMKDEAEMQVWFTKKVAAHLAEKGKTVFGWDEIVGRDHPAGVGVMKWRTKVTHPLPENSPLVMATHNNNYLCYYQDAPAFEPLAFSRYAPLDSTYLYEPLEPGLSPAQKNNVLGMQACTWSEVFLSDEIMEYMLYPRLYASAERSWSPATTRDFTDFRKRAIVLNETMRKLGYNSFDPRKEVGHRPEKLNGIKHLAAGCRITSAGEIDNRFPADGLHTIVDGRGGDWNGDDGCWLGFKGDIDLTLDLGEVKPVHRVACTFMRHKGYSLEVPSFCEVSLSKDGMTWTEPVRQWCNFVFLDIHDAGWPELGVNVSGEARYIRYRAARRQDSIRHPLLTDEIVVY